MHDVSSSQMIQVVAPQKSAIPLVVDSPHSGTTYPDDFNYMVPQFWLRQTEDSYVDDLFSFVPQMGATFLKAHFTRSYIDVNRAMDDLDPAIIDGIMPFALEPTERSLAGYGLIRHLCRGQNVYRNKIPAAEIQKRLQECYIPYHAALKKMMDDTHRQFGNVWHLNCHSMPSHIPATDRPDFILGDRDGVSCAPEFIEVLSKSLVGMGYRVARNDPYKGVEIVRRYGHPRTGFHSVQLEINRALYMNEDTLEITHGFAPLRQNLIGLLGDITRWIAEPSLPEQMAAE